MRFLITGGNGQVAYELKAMLHEKNSPYWAPDRTELDISNASNVMAAIKQYQPTFVINAAAYTKVDLAQQEPSLAYAVNHQGCVNLADACAQANIPLFHISTDYVFDGEADHPYIESSPIIPKNVYGASKRMGEVAIQERLQTYMILRVSGVFGFHGHNFVKTILRLAKEKEELRIVSDQVICPTPAKSIAETIIKMANNPHWGVYHYCGANPTNWYAFASLIVEQARELKHAIQTKKIHAVTTAEYPTPARRPRYSVLNCQHLYKTFGIQQPDWEQGLKHVITQLSA